LLAILPKMSYPRFPAPFLDGLLDYLPLQTVLALTSVDRREAPGREHVINCAAHLLFDAYGNQDAFLAKYRQRKFRAIIRNDAEYDVLCARGSFSRVTTLNLKYSVTDLTTVPPALVHISAPHIYDCSGQLPTTLESIRVEIWPRTAEQFGRLTRLESLETSIMTIDNPDHPVDWQPSLKNLTLIGSEAILNMDHFPSHLTRLEIAHEWHYYDTYYDYSLLTTLKELIFPSSSSQEGYAILDPIQFPDGLTRLEIGLYEPFNYPTGLEYLKTGFCPSMGMIGPIHTLTNLQELVLSECFYGPLSQMPQGLTRLTFLADYKRHFDRVEDDEPEDTLAPIVDLLPASLISLNFRSAPAIERRPDHWPTALTHISVAEAMDHEHLLAFIAALPHTLTHIELPLTQLEAPLAMFRWPSSLRRLTIKRKTSV
jgi:hypothetical protein